jgi:hypothetical protein
MFFKALSELYVLEKVYVSVKAIYILILRDKNV